MRSNMYTFFQMLHNIEGIWEKRGVTDATAEPEWSDYEAFLYTIAEWLYGECGFHFGRR